MRTLQPPNPPGGDLPFGVPVIHYDIDEELHRRAKIAAATLGITLKEFLERALDEKARAVEKRKR